MKTARASRDGAAGGLRRKHRPRPTPKWLENSQELDAIARSRCLMVLSVLSGEKPVTDAIAETKISRGTYYQLEAKALNAMLAALNPIASASESGRAALSAGACAGSPARGARPAPPAPPAAPPPPRDPPCRPPCATHSSSSP